MLTLQASDYSAVPRNHQATQVSRCLHRTGQMGGLQSSLECEVERAPHGDWVSGAQVADRIRLVEPRWAQMPCRIRTGKNGGSGPKSGDLPPDFEGMQVVARCGLDSLCLHLSDNGFGLTRRLHMMATCDRLQVAIFVGGTCLPKKPDASVCC